jgi:hypothetical protein
MVGTLATLTAEVAAQEPIRVVETVNGSTGARQRFVVRDLEAAEIRSVQAALRAQGYVGIGWTGRLDEGTTAGLSRFQRERGLLECGCVSYETVVGLGLLPEVVATVATDGAPPARAGASGGAGSEVGSGILYPVGIPIYVPWPPSCEPEPCEKPDGGEPGNGGEEEPTEPWVVIGAPPGGSASGESGSLATPPGIRPAPPAPARAPVSDPH